MWRWVCLCGREGVVGVCVVREGVRRPRPWSWRRELFPGHKNAPPSLPVPLAHERVGARREPAYGAGPRLAADCREPDDGVQRRQGRQGRHVAAKGQEAPWHAEAPSLCGACFATHLRPPRPYAWLRRQPGPNRICSASPSPWWTIRLPVCMLTCCGCCSPDPVHRRTLRRRSRASSSRPRRSASSSR